MRRRLLGLLVGPMMFAQCAPTKCSPAPPVEPAPTTTTVAVTSPPQTAPPVTTTTVAPPTGLVSWAFLKTSGDLYTRWSSCADPIRYQIDTTFPPSPDVRNAIDWALQAAGAATGRRFEYVGDGGSTLLPTADAVIGLREFDGATLGQGGGRFTASLEMVTGLAYADTGITDAALLRTTLLHEIAHMLGLGHVPDDVQVMYPFVRSPPKQAYQWGDLEGLELVGTSVMPCVASLQDADEPTQEIVLE
jgi:hypothetical protein